MIVAEPSAVTAAGKAIAATPLATWKDWMTFRFISDHAPYLPKAFDDASFGFYSHTLQGVGVAVASAGSAACACSTARLGEAVGELYVRSHWTPETDRQMTELIGDLRAAYSRQDRPRRVDGRADPQGSARQARLVRSADRPSRSNISTIRR